MAVPFLLQGILLGFSIAAPIGPISILCIRRTLVYGYRAGVITGLGIATADGFYGLTAAFGLTLLTTFLVHQQLWLSLVGGAWMCYLGVGAYRSASGTTFLTPSALSDPSPDPSTALLSHPLSHSISQGGRWGLYASALGLTLTNPMTIFIFLTLFAGLGVVKDAHPSWQAGWLVLGVFLGSQLWWVVLSCGVGLLRRRITAQVLTWINRIAGTLIGGFGGLLICKALLGWVLA